MTNMSVSYPPGKGQILFARSKVYIHLTQSRSNNIPGYLVLVRPTKGCHNNDIIVAFITEAEVSSEDKAALDYFDLCGLDGEGNISQLSSLGNEYAPREIAKEHLPKCMKFIDKPRLSSISSYSFGITIGNLFSCQIRPASSNLWHGSILLHPKDSLEKLPALFFHDNECPGFKREQKLKSQNFDPFAENDINAKDSNKANGILYWGGDRFISCLKNYCIIEQSSLEQGMLLINPSSDDLINFIPDVTDTSNDATRDLIKETSESINSFINTTKWKVIGKLASLTKIARDTVTQVVENDKLPITVKQILNKPEVKVISDEFDSANIYLAKWALAVQQEAEKSRKMIIGNDQYHELIKSELGDDFITLTPLEVSKAKRLKPVTKIEWDGFFDNSGRLQVTEKEVKERIFHGGLSEEVRKLAWPFLLEVFPWDTSLPEREQLIETFKESYMELKAEWTMNMRSQCDTEFWKDQKFRIEKDVRRTDRDLEMFKRNVSNPDDPEEEDNEDHDAMIKNPNLICLRDVLITYNEMNVNLGYVQGMCDLLSPLYFVFQDEVMSFWCFNNFMETMERNFIRSQDGMKQQMLTLTELVQFLLPKLYIHLEKCDSDNLFFFFRMLLVWFKREFTFEDTMTLWEILWTRFYSSQFVLFFCVAVLEKHSNIMINNLKSFDQVLKYMNELSGQLDLQDLLIRAELLFLKFKQMVDLIDRKNAKIGIHGMGNNRPTAESSSTTENKPIMVISDELRRLLSKEIIVQKEGPRPEGAGGG